MVVYKMARRKDEKIISVLRPVYSGRSAAPYDNARTDKWLIIAAVCACIKPALL